MPWRLTSDVETYAQHTRDLLTASPAEHTVPLTVLETVRGGHRWSDEPMLFGWFEDGGEVRGAVFRTPPCGGRVVLFTDLADRSANAMYQRIGFRPIGGRRVVRFDGA